MDPPPQETRILLPTLHRPPVPRGTHGGLYPGDSAHQPLQRRAPPQEPRHQGPPRLRLHGPTTAGQHHDLPLPTMDPRSPRQHRRTHQTRTPYGRLPPRPTPLQNATLRPTTRAVAPTRSSSSSACSPYPPYSSDPRTVSRRAIRRGRNSSCPRATTSPSSTSTSARSSTGSTPSGAGTTLYTRRGYGRQGRWTRSFWISCGSRKLEPRSCYGSWDIVRKSICP